MVKDQQLIDSVNSKLSNYKNKCTREYARLEYLCRHLIGELGPFPTGMTKPQLRHMIDHSIKIAERLNDIDDNMEWLQLKDIANKHGLI